MTGLIDVFGVIEKIGVLSNQPFVALEVHCIYLPVRPHMLMNVIVILSSHSYLDHTVIK